MSHQVTVQWRSYELRPKGSPPMPEWYKERIKVARQQFEAMARENYGVVINSGPFGINSRMALIGAKYAEYHSKGNEYHKAVFAAYWQDAKDISDVAILGDIAAEIGLVREDFVSAIQDDELDALVAADVGQAVNYGLTGVPAMIFANKFLVSGAQPYEELARIVEQIQGRLQSSST